jgi:two-component system sensor histidine kinase/response regulator
MSSDASTEQLNVLVVDDEESIRNIVSTWLTRFGYKCTLAKDGLEALLHLDRESYGVVIMDWHMPGMDGMELVRLLRARPFVQVPYLVLTTGDPDREALQKAFKAGVDDFIRKPVDPTELLARLNGARRVLDLEQRVRDQVQGEALMGLHRGSVRELSEVVATLAHDLRTPLATLRMTAESLRTKVANDAPDLLPSVRRMCRVSSSMADTLSDVVSAFLAEDDQESHWVDHDLAAEIRQAVEMISASLPSPSSVVVPQKPFPFRGNPYGLRRIVMNLLSNALRHGRSNSIQIGLEIHRDPSVWALLDIQDDGRGIAEELLPHLGEPMFLSAASHRKEFFVHGTGLGLVICRRIVAEYGGRILVSTGEGKGTRVRIWLKSGLMEPEKTGDFAPIEHEVLS